MQFKDIVGQDAVKERLINTVKDSRISHAQLFLGAEGSGNLAMAIAYSQFIACENKTDDSCGTCLSCIKCSKLAHPDLHFVYPNAGTKDQPSTSLIATWREAVIKNPYLNLLDWYELLGIENKQGTIGVEESHEIVRTLGLMAYEAGYKTMIIWMPEKMNISASNKLLKILEEPPDKTLFLLVAENQDGIINTILSRLQIVKFSRLSETEIYAGLAEKYQLNDEAQLQNIIRMADGNFNTATSLAVAGEADNDNFKSFQQLMRFSYAAKMNELVNWAEEISKSGREFQKSFFNYSIELLRQCLLLNYGVTNLLRLNQQENEFVVKFSPFIHNGNCIEMMNELSSAYYEIERNANPKILFLDLSLNFAKLIKAKSLDL